ncbi:MAG: universal stress protein [Flavobacteriaceae bacterium]|nr:universal stress protein [Flavobacteriaceae bacterium]
MRNILVPLGISDNTEHTLRYAIDLAATTQAAIFVMDSFNPSFSNAHLLNVKEVVNRNNFNRLKALIKSIDHQGLSIQMVNYEGDFLEGVNALDQKVALDLIVCGPMPNSNSDEVFLGPTSGRLAKKTDIPVWIVPEGTLFRAPKKALFAFKQGMVEGERSLQPLRFLQGQFETLIALLLVKTPGNKRKELQIDHEIVELSDHMTSTENGTVYQGVLEYFREVHPDLLIVFARKRGFFEKLIESDVVFKKDFFTKTPLLVIKNRT